MRWKGDGDAWKVMKRGGGEGVRVETKHLSESRAGESGCYIDDRFGKWDTLGDVLG
jgi:hypothetical protein